MAAYGASTTFFALTLSRISKYTGRYILFAVAGLVNLGTFIVLYLWIPSEDNIVIIFLLPVCWGMAEGIWQTQSNGKHIGVKVCEQIETGLYFATVMKQVITLGNTCLAFLLQERICLFKVS